MRIFELPSKGLGRGPRDDVLETRWGLALPHFHRNEALPFLLVITLVFTTGGSQQLVLAAHHTFLHTHWSRIFVLPRKICPKVRIRRHSLANGNLSSKLKKFV